MEAPKSDPLDFPFLRRSILGSDAAFETPFGRRLMVYADYTASGRGLTFIEDYLKRLQRTYANTHTEDDVSGRSMSKLLHEAERIIKNAVHAGPGGRILAVGAGSTAAIDRFQRILGVQFAPATRALLLGILESGLDPSRIEEVRRLLAERRPVVFVGPFEHHSNEVTWREGLAEVVEVGLAPDGGLDLADLERLLREDRYKNRLRIGSFSAASNVTGMRTPVHEVARLLHAHDALACFDYAASAPYVRIDMNPEAGPEGGDPSLDAIFLSPHKFLGGPGAAGILVFQERIYPRDLPPTVAGGGTVAYVGPDDHDFLDDIEEREKAGTPGVLQTFKAALAIELKERIGVERIEARERELLEAAFAQWRKNPRIEILGNPDPARRIGIVSFNLRCSGGLTLHPRFVTVLLNDLFGIQSRAGCSCAGPYGHRLLDIQGELAERYRRQVLEGYQGIKPGWCRVGFHYTMDEVEAAYIRDCVDFVAERGERFLPLYDFDLVSGAWTHKAQKDFEEVFSLDEALKTRGIREESLPEGERKTLYASFLEEARTLAESLPEPEVGRRLEGECGELQFFPLP